MNLNMKKEGKPRKTLRELKRNVIFKEIDNEIGSIQSELKIFRRDLEVMKKQKVKLDSLTGEYSMVREYFINQEYSINGDYIVKKVKSIENLLTKRKLVDSSQDKDLELPVEF